MILENYMRKREREREKLPKIRRRSRPMGKNFRQRLAIKLQEISPTKHFVIVLVKARAIPNRGEHVIRHVLGPLVERELEKFLTHTSHSINNISLNPMVDQLHHNQ